MIIKILFIVFEQFYQVRRFCVFLILEQLVEILFREINNI